MKIKRPLVQPEKLCWSDQPATFISQRGRQHHLWLPSPLRLIYTFRPDTTQPISPLQSEKLCWSDQPATFISHRGRQHHLWLPSPLRRTRGTPSKPRLRREKTNALGYRRDRHTNDRDYSWETF
ncbi:hypothetical protein J6590_065040 [Homalodisca vitripennis]|nr:hypothetical protein J6590_065040 [Homalodisca vitripennis]